MAKHSATLTIEWEVDDTDEAAAVSTAEWETEIKDDLMQFSTEMEPTVTTVTVTKK